MSCFRALELRTLSLARSNERSKYHRLSLRNERLRTFKMEYKESVTTDILEKAIIKAKIAYMKQAM